MSDTSIIESELSKHDGIHKIQNYSNIRKGNCWTRICIGILAFSTILLSIVLVYFLHEKYGTENLEESQQHKTQKKTISLPSAEGVINTIEDVWNAVSNDAEAAYDYSEANDGS